MSGDELDELAEAIFKEIQHPAIKAHSAPVWTKEKPTKPGWYWWRFEQVRKPAIMNVSQGHIDKTEVFTVKMYVFLIDGLPGEWSDKPLEPPLEGT